MNTSKALFLATILSLQISLINAKAQTFYVAPNGVDQTNSGTQNSPWATISFAIDQVSDGATIEVAAGTYNGRVRLDQQFRNGVTIRSATPLSLIHI